MDYFINCGFIDLNTTFNCGQCFRWKRKSEGIYTGVSGNRFAETRQEQSGITLLNINQSDIPYWENYFCACEDYSTIIERFSEDSTLKAAYTFAPGLRILRQEPFETLISFIMSQRNNIKRITGIIREMCREFGRNLPGTENYTFPDIDDFLSIGERDLMSVGTGYRARYILDAVKKVKSGEINLDEIQKMEYNRAKSELLKIIGVGEKIADCVLLFGFHKTEAFPKDVWIKRVLAEYYPDGLPNCVKGYEGIAQQFLFHYIRTKNQQIIKEK